MVDSAVLLQESVCPANDYQRLTTQIIKRFQVNVNEEKQFSIYLLD